MDISSILAVGISVLIFAYYFYCLYVIRQRSNVDKYQEAHIVKDGPFKGYIINDSSGNGSERTWLLAHEGHRLEYRDKALFSPNKTHRLMACHTCKQLLMMSIVVHREI